jgi:hypothetical protein
VSRAGAFFFDAVFSIQLILEFSGATCGASGRHFFFRKAAACFLPIFLRNIPESRAATGRSAFETGCSRREEDNDN